ncbi:exonuclease SbcCD subunit D [Ruminococcus sp. CLA-AA-H200]|uniref:Nuclease SbcCD subunit D n=1 Tax=Ruminococcus turbiniformis TaxID=2881258 RepID=A0ABS8FYL5_9FIRM|nr:exonuclease SbcCD subunit D [Ruminococcus turbiniformis]MCC2255068.1 exonuclease SbcCD subunit D [Ruminococcus turbiniformis]
MKFFHLSDLHIGLKLMNRDLKEDQEYILQQITDIALREQPDAVVIAGDIYDKAVPSAEAVEVFDHFIEGLTSALPGTRIMLISGNHDSGSRLNCFRSVLSRQNVYMIGLPPRTEEEHIERVVLSDEYGDVNFYLLPFVRPSMVRLVVGTDDNGNSLSYNDTLCRLIEREEIDDSQRNVIVSHQFYLPKGKNAEEVERMDSEIRTVGNIDEVSADILKAFDYAALGHIHKPMKVGGELCRYCGTPLACSVSEAGQQKGIISVEMGEKGDVRTEVIPLTPLRQIRVVRGSLGEVLEQACADFTTVILTDKVDLDVLDMQDRLRSAFPFLLEIRRETERTADYSAEYVPEEELDPFELCCSFLKNVNAEEEELLRDVINTVQEGM